jgi:hypothetical protein
MSEFFRKIIEEVIAVNIIICTAWIFLGFPFTCLLASIKAIITKN